LNQQVERVRANLESAQSVASGGKLDKWIDDLDESENEIRKINKKTLPELAKKISSLTEEMSVALQKVTAKWKEK
jgi:prefoldin subunit 5